MRIHKLTATGQRAKPLAFICHLFLMAVSDEPQHLLFAVLSVQRCSSVDLPQIRALLSGPNSSSLTNLILKFTFLYFPQECLRLV